jgi:hypothetical protein
LVAPTRFERMTYRFESTFFRCGHHCSLRRKPGDITLTYMGLLVYGLRLNGD